MSSFLNLSEVKKNENNRTIIIQSKKTSSDGKRDFIYINNIPTVREEEKLEGFNYCFKSIKDYRPLVIKRITPPVTEYCPETNKKTFINFRGTTETDKTKNNKKSMTEDKWILDDLNNDIDNLNEPYSTLALTEN